MAALLVPLDAITRAQANPVRHRLVLVHLLRVLLLHRERLEATHDGDGGLPRGGERTKNGSARGTEGNGSCDLHATVQHTHKSRQVKEKLFFFSLSLRAGSDDR